MGCCKNNTSQHPPSGKLHHLPIHNQPWSYLIVPYMTYILPSSSGNIGIMIVVDRFSIPLDNLPTAMETKELLFQDVSSVTVKSAYRM